MHTLDKITESTDNSWVSWD